MVEVGYLPERLSFEALLEVARSKGCTKRVFTTTAAQLKLARARVGEAALALEGQPRAAKGSDQLYYLRRSPLRFLPLTALQARRVNAALGTAGGDPGRWLSPRQSLLLERIEAAVESDANALDGLERPDDPARLDEYSRRLAEQLPD